MRVVVDSDAPEKVKQAVVPWMADDLGPKVEDRARRYCPVDTGSLRDSIENHIDDTTLVISATGGDDGRSYAAYIELGHRVFHPSTGEVGPEWVPGVHFLRSALYDESASLRAKRFRNDRILQDRIAAHQAEERRRRAHERAEDTRRRLAKITPEQNARFAERDRLRAEEQARQRNEDWRIFTRGENGEKRYVADTVREREKREAVFFAEKWRREHPGEPWSDAPPF